MKKVLFALVILTALSSSPVNAQLRSFGSTTGGYGTSAGAGASYGGVGAGVRTSPYINQGFSPYGGYSPYGNPYANPYGAYIYNGVPVAPAVNPYAYGGYGIPQPLGGSNFGINFGNRTMNMWRGPSGYYYPWAYGGGYGVQQSPIVIVQNGASQPSEPPISTELSDLMKYLDEQKSAGKIDATEFTHLKQRALDLVSKERDMRTQGDGTLDSQTEKDIRRDVDSLGGEIARKVKP